MKTKKHVIETSITTKYREDAWDLDRIILDTISNHLPKDSNGYETKIFLKQNGIYVPLENADKNVKTEEVIFEDDGSGYHWKLLSVLFSTKDKDPLSVGQFGEGAKLAPAAAIRNKIELEYHSRNWIAKPYLKPIEIELTDKETKETYKETVYKLCFNVDEYANEEIKGSRTILRRINNTFLDEIFKIKEDVLYFNKNYDLLYTKKFEFGYSPSIIKLNNPSNNVSQNKIFIKGVKIQSEALALFSYDLGEEHLSADRKYVNYESKMRSVKNLLISCNNEEIIKIILTEAKDIYANYLEFEALNYEDDIAVQSSLQSSRNTIVGKKEKYSFKQGLGISSIDFNEILEEIKSYNLAEIKNEKKYNLEEKITDYNIHPMSDYELERIRRNELQSKAYLWKKMFYSMFDLEENGIKKTAVLASEKEQINEDAKHLGYNPIKLNKNIKNFLIKLNIPTADECVSSIIQDYKWLTLDDLTSEEKEIIKSTKQINEILGYNKPIELRIYSGIYSSIGRELKSMPSTKGNESGNSYIAIRRDQLISIERATKLYIQELSSIASEDHKTSRTSVDFYTHTLVKLAYNEIQK